MNGGRVSLAWRKVHMVYPSRKLSFGGGFFPLFSSWGIFFRALLWNCSIDAINLVYWYLDCCTVSVSLPFNNSDNMSFWRALILQYQVHLQKLFLLIFSYLDHRSLKKSPSKCASKRRALSLISLFTNWGDTIAKNGHVALLSCLMNLPSLDCTVSVAQSNRKPAEC